MASLSRSSSSLQPAPKMSLEIFLRDCVFVLLKHISGGKVQTKMDEKILEFCIRSGNNVCDQGRLFLHSFLERKMRSLYPNSACDDGNNKSSQFSVINEATNVKGCLSLSDPKQTTILQDLNKELNLVQRENNHLIEEVEVLRMDIASLRSIIVTRGFNSTHQQHLGQFDSEKINYNEGSLHSQPEIQECDMARGKKSRKSTPTAVSKAKAKVKPCSSTQDVPPKKLESDSSGPSHDTFSIDRVRVQSEGSDEGEDPRIDLWDTIRHLREELIKITKKQESLIKDMTSKDGELVHAEEHINELMQELDANKMEYNAHQKVIQILKTEQSQSKEDLQKALISIPEEIAISSKPLATLFGDDISSQKSIFNLKLEQVDIKRQLAKSMAEHDKLLATHLSLADEYEALKEDFTNLIGRPDPLNSDCQSLNGTRALKEETTKTQEAFRDLALPELEDTSHFEDQSRAQEHNNI
ncbi:hypothetical protein TCAL_05723 [Tigriopus californicus]|uniref:Uncharacterized protein n=2 Tax=Tigriopus californicus TaxID=6832 RepID=A0A553N9V3_TIGCA|nr:hypothetical protein TCAL_05723 [Tigriopus californicus]